MKNIFCFHNLDLNLKSSYQIASLLDSMYIDVDKSLRITGNQEGPPQIAKNIQFVYILTHTWKTGFQ